MPETDFCPTVLCIGGLDPSGGAGLGADTRACTAFGALALPVATAIVAQNTRGVRRSQTIAPEMLHTQIAVLLEDIRPAAVKIGLIPDVDSVEILVPFLRQLQGVPLVVDTVFAPSTGPIFSDAGTIEAIARQILPLATLITPNALEALQLGAAPMRTEDEMKGAACLLFERYGAAVLLKGGHLSEMKSATDMFFDGAQFQAFQAPREHGYEVRGTGCLLASAIAAGLARDHTLLEAIGEAKIWLTGQFRAARRIGDGRRVTAI